MSRHIASIDHGPWGYEVACSCGWRLANPVRLGLRDTFRSPLHPENIALVYDTWHPHVLISEAVQDFDRGRLYEEET